MQIRKKILKAKIHLRKLSLIKSQSLTTSERFRLARLTKPELNKEFSELDTKEKSYIINLTEKMPCKSIKALSAFGSKKSIPFLMACLGDPNPRIYAASLMHINSWGTRSNS